MQQDLKNDLKQTSELASKSDLANLKTEMDKLDIDKLNKKCTN